MLLISASFYLLSHWDAAHPVLLLLCRDSKALQLFWPFQLVVLWGLRNASLAITIQVLSMASILHTLLSTLQIRPIALDCRDIAVTFRELLSFHSKFQANKRWKIIHCDTISRTYEQLNNVSCKTSLNSINSAPTRGQFSYHRFIFLIFILLKQRKRTRLRLCSAQWSYNCLQHPS